MKISHLLENRIDLQETSPEVLIEWCRKNANGFLKMEHPIFRGDQFEKSFGLFDTNALNRESANTYNYYNLWMSNHDSWSVFPKRAKSLICTTSRRVSGGYGYYRFLIIPDDTNFVGICPKKDLWISFGESGFGSLDDLMTGVNAIFNRILDSNQNVKVRRNYDDLLSALKGVRHSDVKALLNQRVDIDRIELIMEKQGLENLYEFFEWFFNPRRNHFELETAANFSATENDNREVWVQGKCAIISLSPDAKLPDELKKFVDEIAP